MMERPKFSNYPYKNRVMYPRYFDLDQDKYIDQLEAENEGLKVQMRALQDAVNELQSQLKEREDKIKLLEACREYDASSENRPDGYIVPNHFTGNRISNLKP